MLRVLALLLFPLVLHAQTITLTLRDGITPVPDSMRKYDTLAIQATPKDARGRVMKNASIAWSTNPSGYARVVATGQHGQQASIIGNFFGATTITALVTNSTNKTTKAFKVTYPEIFTVLPYLAFDSAGRGYMPPLILGDSVLNKRCVYVLALDKYQVVVTGMTPKIEISDTTVISPGSHPACPDTTVNPLKLTLPTQPPRP
jgi:hypothetical protein